MTFSLSVIIPAYNEAARLGRTLEATFQYLNQHYPSAEIIVVDDGSTDATIHIAEQSFAASANKVAARVIPVKPNKGKGFAVRTGLRAARAPIALFSDADLSTPIEETAKLVRPIQDDEYDVVFGSRALDRTLIGTHQPWHREQGGRAFNFAMRWATQMPFKDTQCGFKAFRMNACRPLTEAAQIDRFGFDVELLYLAYKAGLRMKETPVRWNDAEGSKVSTARALHAFNEIRQIHRFAKRGVYDAAIKETKTKLKQ